MSSIFIHLEDEDDYEVFTKQAKVCVVDFHAKWCGPCKSMSTELETSVSKSSFVKKLTTNKDSLKDNVVFLKVNVDDFGDLASVHKCKSIPYVLFYKNGELQKKRIVGNDASDVIKTTEELLL